MTNVKSLNVVPLPAHVTKFLLHMGPPQESPVPVTYYPFWSSWVILKLFPMSTEGTHSSISQLKTVETRRSG